MTMNSRKVVSAPTFKTSDPAVFVKHDKGRRVVIAGVREMDSDLAVGYFGKVVEASGGANLLDFGVWIDLLFPHVIGIFGTRGTGKSFDLGVLSECISGMSGVVSGHLPASATVIFDVQDQFWTLGFMPDAALAEDRRHLEELQRWGLSPAALEQLHVLVPQGVETELPNVTVFRVDPDQLSSDDWLALLELERYSPMGQALLALLRSCSSCEPAALAAACLQEGVLTSFQAGTVDALRWRLDALVGTDLVGSPGIDPEDLLVTGRTTVFLLRTLPDALRNLCAGVMIRLLTDRMSRSQRERKVARRLGIPQDGEVLPDRLWIVLDEAHTFAPREGTTASTAPVIDYVKRGRDAGLSLVFATQQPAAVDNRLMSQVDMTITHALSFEVDLQAAVARMPTRTSVTYERGGFRLSSLGDVIRSLDPGEALIADSCNGRVFAVRVRPRRSAHGGHVPTSVGG